MEAARAERNSLSQKIGAKRQGRRTLPRRKRSQRTLAARISSFEERSSRSGRAIRPHRGDAPEHPAGGRAGRRRRGAERRPEDVGRADALRLPAARALGSRAGARHPRLRARGQDHRVALHRAQGAGVASVARAHPVHARPAHARARLHRGAAALPRELRLALRHRPAPEVRGGSFPRRGDGLVPDAHGRGARHESPPRRDAFPEGAAHLLLRVHAVLPRRGGSRGQGHARHDPPAPVRQGRAREVHEPPEPRAKSTSA